MSKIRILSFLNRNEFRTRSTFRDNHFNEIVVKRDKEEILDYCNFFHIYMIYMYVNNMKMFSGAQLMFVRWVTLNCLVFRGKTY